MNYNIYIYFRCLTGHHAKRCINLGNVWRWEVSFMPRPIYPQATNATTLVWEAVWVPEPAHILRKREKSCPAGNKGRDRAALKPFLLICMSVKLDLLYLEKDTNWEISRTGCREEYLDLKGRKLRNHGKNNIIASYILLYISCYWYDKFEEGEVGEGGVYHAWKR